MYVRREGRPMTVQTTSKVFAQLTVTSSQDISVSRVSRVDCPPPRQRTHRRLAGGCPPPTSLCALPHPACCLYKGM
jgi:hypothetical protein